VRVNDDRANRVGSVIDANDKAILFHAIVLKITTIRNIIMNNE
jgi:hypothetical protein